MCPILAGGGEEGEDDKEKEGKERADDILEIKKKSKQSINQGETKTQHSMPSLLGADV